MIKLKNKMKIIKRKNGREFKKNLILNISNIDGVEIKSIFEHKLFLKRKIIILFLLFFIFYIICFFFIFIIITTNICYLF